MQLAEKLYFGSGLAPFISHFYNLLINKLFAKKDRMVVYVTNLIIAKDRMLMFIRRALAVSLSLLFILSLFFPLKAVMAASPAAPVPAPPAVVPPAIGADSGKPPSDDNKQPSTPPAVVPPAVPSDDNKQSGASPSPVAPKVEAGLSQEPKQAVSPEAEEKAGSPQSNKVAPPLTNEEKRTIQAQRRCRERSKLPERS